MSESQPYATGTAKIQHKTSGSTYTIQADELEWDVASSDERDMGDEIQWSAQIEHDELGTLVWSVWEYPSGVENMSETDAGGHTVVENFMFGLS